MTQAFKMEWLNSVGDGMRPILDDGIYKSPYDTRKYKYHQLQNGMKLFLISDVTQESESEDSQTEELDLSDSEDSGLDSDSQCSLDKHMVSASICVHSGSLQDPPDIPGLSHFLEHLLFMGSEKYPDPSEFGKYISDHGGMTNAYTSAEQTNYFFALPLDFFEDALDRFVQFFISPLFSQDTVDKERIAVDNEFQRLKLNEHMALTQLLQSLMIPNHPLSFFQAGNLITLKDNIENSGIDLRDRVRKHWIKYYSTHIMTAVIYAPVQMSIIEKAVCSILNSIPAKPMAQELQVTHDWNTVFDMNKYNQIITYKSFKESPVLTLSWIIPPQKQLIKTKPFDTISYILGHEGCGSLFSYFKKKNWIYKLVSGSLYMDTLCNKHFSTYQIQLELSIEGLNHYEEIIKVILNYIHMLTICESLESIYSENETIHLIHFLFNHLEHPSMIASNISSIMDIYQPEYYLLGQFVSFYCDINELLDSLRYLTSNNLNVLVGTVDNIVGNSHIEPWFNISYISNDIPANFLSALEENIIPESLTIPSKNPFLPTSLEITEPDKEISNIPECLLKNDRGSLHYMYDSHFKLPRCDMRLCIRPRMSHYDKMHSLIHFYCFAFTFIHQELIYQAEMGHINLSIEKLPIGNILFSIEGIENKIDVFIFQILDYFKNFTISQVQFDNIKNKIVNKLTDTLKKQSKFRKSLATKLLQRNSMSNIDLLQEIQYLNYNEFNKFQHEFQTVKIFIDGLICGCVTSKRGVDVFTGVLKIFSNPPLPFEIFPRENFVELEKFDIYSTVSRQINDNQMTIMSIFQFGNLSFSRSVIMFVINQFLSPYIFESLRDSEQLGYDVYSTILFPYRATFLCIGVVADIDKHSCEYIDSRIENAIVEFLKILQSISLDDYSTKINAIIKKVSQVDHSLDEMTHRFFSEIIMEQMIFNRKLLIAQQLVKVSKESIFDIAQEYLAKDSLSRRKMLMQIVGSTQEKSNLKILP